MGNRRMFSKAIVNSGRFLRMSPGARLLYYDLGMAADDDGVVEAYSVIALTNASEDNLQELVDKEFLTILNDDLVAYINDWKVNNYIQKDRYTASIYSDLISRIRNVSNMDTQCIQLVSSMDTQVKLSKDKLSKDKLSKSKPAQSKHKYGDYKNVLLTDNERDTLFNEYGEPETIQAIKYLDEYIEMKGAKYKSHYLAMRRWVYSAVKERKKKNNDVAEQWLDLAEELVNDRAGNG